MLANLYLISPFAESYGKFVAQPHHLSRQDCQGPVHALLRMRTWDLGIQDVQALLQDQHNIDIWLAKAFSACIDEFKAFESQHPGITSAVTNMSAHKEGQSLYFYLLKHAGHPSFQH